jgi:hypothetical protein
MSEMEKVDWYKNRILRPIFFWRIDTRFWKGPSWPFYKCKKLTDEKTALGDRSFFEELTPDFEKDQD